MRNTAIIVKLLLSKFPFGNIFLTVLMAAVLFLASMLTREYALSSGELSCYAELARSNAIIVEASDAAIDFEDEHIISVFRYKSVICMLEDRPVTVRFFDGRYLAMLDASVNKGRWFKGADGQCVTVNMDVSVGENLTVDGQIYKVAGKINDGEYFPVINVYKSNPSANLSLLWTNASEIPNIIVSAESDAIQNPTHYVIITDAPADSLELFDDTEFVSVSALYINSEQFATYNNRVLLPLAVMSAVLAALAITVISGIMVEKNRKLFTVFALYGGSLRKGYFCGVAYLSVLIITAAALAFTAFRLSGDRALNSFAVTVTAAVDIAIAVLFYLSFTLSFAVKNSHLNYSSKGEGL